MNSFEVKDMTCGHCVSTIAKAVKALDADAKVQIDLGAHRVEIESSAIDAAQCIEVIKEAGYTPVAVPAASHRPSVRYRTDASKLPVQKEGRLGADPMFGRSLGQHPSEG